MKTSPVDKGGINKAFNRDLAETAVGGLILRYLIPLLACSYGIWTLVRGRFKWLGDVLHGTPAYLCGAAFIVIGMALLRYPTTRQIQEGTVPRSTSVRLWSGIILFALLLIAAILTQFRWR